ncbi:neural-cadherin isoform X3 [Lytechinus variegatus]|uniref:neural-cadherin isoform X3 n=1 Tax=Lytechinus variegatus TaxID=7654 RepID=UPI001BB283E5|nr:neural-cadherin isoform X3 [Lytechinus variegatus]
MAVKLRWNMTRCMCLSAIFLLATLQLTIGLTLPKINVPSNALPGFRVTEVKKDGQSSELLSDSDIHNLFQIAENGALEVKNSLKHLANSDIALKIRHTLRDRSWDDLLNMYVEDSSLEFIKKSYRGYVLESDEANQEVVGLDDLQVNSTKPISYQLAGEDSDDFRLQVGPEGRVHIFTKAPIDMDTTSQYHLEMVASDLDLSKATAELLIDVVTANNQVPPLVKESTNQFHAYGNDMLFPPAEPVEMVHVRVQRDVLPGESVDLPESTEVDVVVHTITVVGTDLRYAMGSPANEKFSIDEMSGEIRLLETINYESYAIPQEIVNVVITNASHSEVSDTLVVTFDIQDADDPPVWTMPVYPYITVVPTDAPNQACIYRLQASDEDPGSEITFSLVAGDSGAFSVGETDGCINTVVNAQNPNYEDGREYVLSVRATGTSNDFVGAVDGTVFVFGGSHPPQFSQEEYSASVREAQNNQMVIQVEASSFSRNVPVTYSIVGPENRPSHTINADSGVITLTEAVLVEDMQSYFLIVRATEQGGNQLSSDVRVNVMIEDINNCVPTFGQEILSFNDVSETTAIGEPVGEVTATDCDVGVNAELTYSITTPNSGFTIGPDDGVISPAVILDYEEGERYYTFVVAATDGGSPPTSGTATVVISIANAEEAPYFTPTSYSFRVDETAQVGYEVGTVYASDDDVGDSLTLDIPDGGGPFDINDSGVISMIAAATDSSYTFEVVATDQTGNSAMASVQVSFTDLNDNIPTFPNCGSYSGTVAEDAAIDTSIITVSASDLDQGSNAEITYQLASNTDANQVFKVDQDGLITTKKLLDREDTSSFVVTVEAEDGGNPSLTGFCTFSVVVTDVDDNYPEFPFTDYKASVLSDAPSNSEVVSVPADDLDSSSTLQYDLASSQEECRRYFTMSPADPVIITRGDLSAISGNDVSCIVTASDTLRESRVDVDIFVRSPDDTTYQVPTFSNTPYQVTINENTTIGDVILLVSVDGAQEVGFDIVRGSRPSTNSDGTFTLTTRDDNLQSDLTLVEKLDFEAVQEYELLVTAQYVGVGQEFIAQTTVTVTIEDFNDVAPKFPAVTFYGNIAENQPVSNSDPIITLQATDGDVTPEFSQISYSFVNAESDFSIDEDTGEIFALKVFDREAIEDSSIALTVRASDGVNQDLATVFITIVDENDNEPEFNGTFSFDVLEDVGMGYDIGTVTATDDDISEVLEYFISGGNEGGAFTVDAEEGTIRKAGVLDYEARTSYELQYSVNDGKNVATTTVTINVLNVNDVAPQFDQSAYSASVIEEDDSNLPRILLSVAATDGDADAVDDAVVYGLVGTGAGTIFTIDSQTGNITLTQALDREEIPTYNLAAVATDDNGNGLTSYVDVTIEVEDINDNAPVFPDQEYVGSVEENRPPNTPVVAVVAEDPDTADDLMYSFPTPSPDFNINSQTGQITTARQFDRETPPSEYEIEVQATDGVNTASTTVTISIDDVDDNKPSFSEDVYPDASVLETEPIGTTITTVQAIDPDVDFRDAVEFSINSGDPDELFRIVADAATLQGLIQVNKELDFETLATNEFTLTVAVTDSQGPTDSGRPETAIVKIIVENANDLAPVFDQDVYDGDVSEDAAINSQVGTFTFSATDGDEPGATLNYIIDPTTDPDGQFAINENQQLIVASPLDRETVASYELKVYAVDNGEPPMSGTATVAVTVTDVNDTPPRFAQDYNPSVEEGPIEANVEVVSVEAVDDDDPPSGPPFLYNVAPQPNDWTTFFDIEGLGTSTSGSIRVSTTGLEIDRETHPYFDIVFLIAEVGTPEALTGTQTLTIMISDVNDNPHVAITKDILVYSYEGNIPTTEVGKVGVEDPDILEDKTYEAVGELPDFFQLDSDTGDITMAEGTPAGVYEMDIRVSDDGTYESVVSTVIVTVKDIPREAVFSSGSIRFSGTTAEELITPDSEGVSNLDRLKVILANAVGAQLANFDIFSVLNVVGMERTVDIRYAAHGSPYYPADQLDLAALSVSNEIEELGLSIAQIPVDLCVKENVCESSCTNVLVVDPTPTVVDSGTASLVAITSVLEAQCICGARTVTPGNCDSDPCLNGGTCEDVHGGTYRCTCPYLFDGPNCQQTKRSFENGYASFSTLRQCEETSLSIEFITEVSSGTLLYNGPIFTPTGDDPIDMILLELIGGKARLTINLGSTDSTDDNLVLEAPTDDTQLNDNEWHRIDVYRNGRFVEMTVDRCMGVFFAETSSSSTLDTSSCRVNGTTPGENNLRFLNVHTPLFLGGMSADYDVTVPSGFDGCIKNLVSDGFLYDLGTPGTSSKSEAGCPRTDGQCTDDNGMPVCNNGTCEADIDSFICICFPGFNGLTCDVELTPYDFAIESYITYELLDSSLYDDARSSNYQIMVRTRQENGLIWSISSANTYEYIRMEMVQGELKADWHLGDKPVSVTMVNFSINDGAWHAINFDRYDSVVTIKIDGGGGVKEIQNRESQYSGLDVDENSLVIGAFVDVNTVTDDFMGCMNDPRINHNFLGMEGTNDYAVATKSAGVTEGCPSDVCDSDPCPGSVLVCTDYWRFYECLCPEGQEEVEDDPDTCMAIIDCVPNPCANGGTCVEGDPTGYTCDCPSGYYGDRCEAAFGEQGASLGITPLGIILMILCILLIIILLLGLVLYTQRRDRKSALAFAIDPEDDIRENFINYDEEGGGEEDNDAYDLSTLRKPVDAISAGSIEKKPVAPVSEVPVGRPSGVDPNVGDFINDRLKGANDDPEGPPYDEPHIYDYEGDGSTAGSLSSLNSSSTDSEQNYDYLNDWGPQFRKLADMYGS